MSQMDSQSSATLQSPSTYSDSSKTQSTRSLASSREEEDLTKDNSASPIDLECHIQAERITKILDEAIYKTKLAICLPIFVQEYRTLSSILKVEHMDDLTFIFEQYDNPLFSTSLLNVAAMEDIKAGDISLKNRLNPELGHLMYILNSYPQLRPKAEQLIAEIKEEHTPDNIHMRRKVPGLEYLLTLENFRDMMVKQMEMTAAEELEMKMHTRKLEASNGKLLEKIQEYTKCLKEENESFEKSMRIKSEMISKLEYELGILNRDADIFLKKKILDSDRQMVLATRSHLIKSEMLKEEEVESRSMYENLLKAHLIEEKNQRARRFKVETQLLSWLQKYDLEMGDKQLELDEFTDNYEDELKKCEELEKKLAEQDIEYIPLMEEREAEYQQELTEKMNRFMLEHAARVIQVAWREVLQNRAEKRRLKKLQKKMQAAAAKAAKK
ncbi:dynein regulatory complex protein 10-like [Leptidea sinapis]|uniref:Dynein regulatory complex protein 10 n=1 Tax=Leptidea sinapis TaxID=189913 RepID=A0A5E4Q1U0_9NEOP|nr:dynein regulatory complex protein 10-like [Leptidea sinapis]VVC91267.1 unnamed protein product [Leptidea sinapis]